MRRSIINTDTASNDAVSIMMTMASSAVKAESLSIVAGTVTVAQGTIHARRTRKVCNDSFSYDVSGSANATACLAVNAYRRKTLLRRSLA